MSNLRQVTFAACYSRKNLKFPTKLSRICGVTQIIYIANHSGVIPHQMIRWWIEKSRGCDVQWFCDIWHFFYYLFIFMFYSKWEMTQYDSPRMWHGASVTCLNLTCRWSLDPTSLLGQFLFIDIILDLHTYVFKNLVLKVYRQFPQQFIAIYLWINNFGAFMIRSENLDPGLVH